MSALEGLLVVDLTRNLAGPYCTMILGDLGARVIKLERPGVGDDTRDWRPPDWDGESPVFLTINRNKESIALDLEDPAQVDALKKLIAKADVLVESNRNGTLEKHGLDFESVRRLNEDIVYASISGFGAAGPGSDRLGYDAIVQAASGIMSINGDPLAGPARVGPSIIDMGTGMWLALGVLAGLRERDQTGEAQHVVTSLLEVGVGWMAYYVAGFLADGTIPERLGSRHALVAPYEAFETADGSILIATLNNNLYRRLCAALGLPELADDARFLTNPDRVANRDSPRTDPGGDAQEDVRRMGRAAARRGTSLLDDQISRRGRDRSPGGSSRPHPALAARDDR